MCVGKQTVSYKSNLRFENGGQSTNCIKSSPTQDTQMWWSKRNFLRICVMVSFRMTGSCYKGKFSADAFNQSTTNTNIAASLSLIQFVTDQFMISTLVFRSSKSYCGLQWEEGISLLSLTWEKRALGYVRSTKTQMRLRMCLAICRLL